AAIEVPQRDDFQHDAQQQRRAQRKQNADDEIAAPGDEGRGKIGSHHVQRAMGEIDQIHDAELQSVEKLFDDEQHDRLHGAERKQRRRASAAAAWTQSPDHFIGHLSWKRSWSSLTMVATVLRESWPAASLTTSCR